MPNTLNIIDKSTNIPCSKVHWLKQTNYRP